MEEGHCRRKICRIFSILIIFFFLISLSSALASINIDLDESGNAIFIGTSSGQVSLPDYLALNNGKITGITSNLTSKSGDQWHFSFFLESSHLNLLLPPGAVIDSLSSGEISTLNNQIEIIAQDNLDVYYRLSPVNSSPNLIYLLYTLIAILLLALLYFVYSRLNENRKSKSQKLEIIKRILSEREKLILENLKKSGKIKSSQLRKLCDIPKASFSRHIQELEKKRLIKRSGEGKNKFIEIYN